MKLKRKTANRIIDILTPLVADESKQQAIVKVAFWETSIPEQIKYGDSADVFAVQLVTLCQNYEMLDDEEHAIEALLKAIRRRVGHNIQREIDTIQQELISMHKLNMVENTQFSFDSKELIAKVFEAIDSGNWKAAKEILGILSERNDLPEQFHLQNTTYIVERAQEYNFIKLLARYESADVVSDALLNFWKKYPSHDPEDLLEYTEMRNFEEYHEAIERIKALGSSITLDLSNLNLTMIPISMTRKINLREVNLSGNRLSYLPKQITNLSRLVTLNLHDNEITYLPEYITELTSLRILCLSRNQLETLPSSLSNLINLEELHLHNNRFMHIPNCVTSLKNIEKLTLSYNKLEDIPHTVGTMPKLHSLYIKGNPLSKIPSEVVAYDNPDFGYFEVLEWIRNNPF